MTELIKMKYNNLIWDRRRIEMTSTIRRTVEIKRS